MKKALFIDRDGTLIVEPEDEQIDSLEKLEFLPKVFRNMFLIMPEKIRKCWRACLMINTTKHLMLVKK